MAHLNDTCFLATRAHFKIETRIKSNEMIDLKGNTFYFPLSSKIKARNYC